MHDNGLAASAVQYALALPTMYALLSAHEYMAHRYLQHLEFNRPQTMVGFKRLITACTGITSFTIGEGNGHPEHHSETLDDMTLRNDEAWRGTPAANALDRDAWRGTAFGWQEYVLVAVTMPVYVLPTFLSMGWSVGETFCIFLPSLFLHFLVWNALHPPMHGLPRVPWRKGPPSFILADALVDSKYGKWLFENHMGHHVCGGKANYNVVCPLLDHQMGTYVPPRVWKRQMRPIPKGMSVRGPAIAPAGVPQPPPTKS